MRLLVKDLGHCPYPAALELQLGLVERKLAGDPTNYLLLVEHDSVYTLGRGADEQDLQGAHLRLGVPWYRTGRGGGVTYHGPGQLVAYPILSLESKARDVGRYVHGLEQAIIACCAEFGVEGARRAGSPGVWAGARKLASVGVAIKRWVTFHGIALNVTTDLAFFGAIVPCREPAMRLTSLAELLAPPPSLDAIKRTFVACFDRQFSGEMASAEAI